MPWLNKRWISFFTISAVAGIVLISLIGWANTQEGDKVRNKLDSFGTNSDDNTNWTTPQVVGTEVQVNSFDPNGKAGPSFGVKLTFEPVNDTLTSPIIIFLSPQIIQLNLSNDDLKTQAASLDAFGVPNSYPFDSYQSQIEISTFNNGSVVPLTVFVYGSVQGFVYTTHFDNGSASNDGTDVIITFDVRRNTITRLFAAITFLLMWFLSLTIFVAAMSVWFRGKNAELPLVTISAALLFALPNIRNSQPGVPSPVGTTEDMVGFFWNILLVAVSVISLLVKWILQNKRPPRQPTVVSTDPENVGNPHKSG